MSYSSSVHAPSECIHPVVLSISTSLSPSLSLSLSLSLYLSISPPIYLSISLSLSLSLPLSLSLSLCLIHVFMFCPGVENHICHPFIKSHLPIAIFTTSKKIRARPSLVFLYAYLLSNALHMQIKYPLSKEFCVLH